MSVVSNLKVVDKVGNTVINVDENGFRDGSTISRVFSPFEFLFDRIFATPLAAYMWRCFEGVWQVTNVGADCSVTGGAGTTLDVLVCSAGQAPGAGVSQLTAVVDIEETAPFQRSGTLIASPTLIHPGMLISRVYAGTVAAVEGILTVQIRRVS